MIQMLSNRLVGNLEVGVPSIKGGLVLELGPTDATCASLLVSAVFDHGYFAGGVCLAQYCRNLWQHLVDDEVCSGLLAVCLFVLEIGGLKRI